MRLHWRAMAHEDRDAIFEYVAQDSPAAALALDEAFEAKAQMACQHPKLYRIGRTRGTREIVVRSNYVMVYRIDAETITILRVLHAAQQWPSAK